MLKSTALPVSRSALIDKKYAFVSFTGSGNADLTVKFPIPKNLSSGKYYFFAVIDPHHKIKESSENNNVDSCTVTCVAEGPGNDNDLELLWNGRPPVKAVAGRLLRLKFRCFSTFTGPVKSVALDAVLTKQSSCPVPAGSHVAVKRTIYIHFSGAGQANRIVGLPIPPKTPAGKYWVVAMIDPKNKLKEKSEKNNCCAARIKVERPGLTPGRGGARKSK